MKNVGIICEYNPFHNGHLRQIQWLREFFGGEECAIICLMSGNFVQRGAPAIVDKSIRAQAALQSGADLILELPAAVSLSSAEGFAAGGVKILSECCDFLCFGVESMTPEALQKTAEALLRPDFPPLLKEEIASGCSFPAARQAALSRMGVKEALVKPNDILGVEYTKAILQQNCAMQILPVLREGDYHCETLNLQAPSATAVRRAMVSGDAWEYAVPAATVPLLKKAPLHTLEAGERAILSRLRSMTESEFAAVPQGSEGLWRKFMRAVHTQNDLESIIDSVKSKRYTRTRIDRMILCAFLGLTQEEIGILPPKIRVLGFTDRGRSVLRKHSFFCNAGEEVDETEQRLGGLYGLFCVHGIEPYHIEQKRRIIYLREES